MRTIQIRIGYSWYTTNYIIREQNIRNTDFKLFTFVHSVEHNTALFENNFTLNNTYRTILKYLLSVTNKIK